MRANVKRGATLLTDGHASYPGLTDYRHDPRIVGKMAGHVVLPWIYRAFSLMKRWSLGTYHGLRRTHVDTYLNEFVFRYNRRFHRHVSFEALLGLAAHHAPASYWDIVQRDNPRKGVQTIRRTPRRRKTATGMRQDGAPPAFGAAQNQPIKPVHPLTSLGQRDKPRSRACPGCRHATRRGKTQISQGLQRLRADPEHRSAEEVGSESIGEGAPYFHPSSSTFGRLAHRDGGKNF